MTDQKAERLLNSLLKAKRLTKEEYEILSEKTIISNEQFKKNIILKNKIKASLIQINEEMSPDIISMVATAILISHNKEYLRIHDILQEINTQFRCTYAENSREIIRKTALKYLIKHNLVIDNGLAKTSPKFAYAATDKLRKLQ